MIQLADLPPLVALLIASKQHPVDGLAPPLWAGSAARRSQESLLHIEYITYRCITNHLGVASEGAIARTT